jgi:hypothetical protein
MDVVPILHEAQRLRLIRVICDLELGSGGDTDEDRFDPAVV